MSPSALAAASRCTSGGAARIQPTRRPPQNDLDTDPIDSTLVPSSKAAIGGGSCAEPGNGTSRNDSSTISSVRLALAAATNDSRVATSIRAPVGFWKSGIR